MGVVASPMTVLIKKRPSPLRLEQKTIGPPFLCCWRFRALRVESKAGFTAAPKRCTNVTAPHCAKRRLSNSWGRFLS